MTIFPFHPFQQAVVQLIPYRTHTRMPVLLIVLNDPFDHRIQFTGQMCNWLAPLVDLQLSELPSDRRFRNTAHKGTGHQFPTAPDIMHHWSENNGDVAPWREDSMGKNLHPQMMVDGVDVRLDVKIDRKVMVETIPLTLSYRIMCAATGTIPE